MLRFSRKVDYGVLILSHFARVEGQSISAAELARGYKLSRPFVANILKDLTRAGLLTSTRGASGGYELAKAARDIPLSEVIAALEGEFRMITCSGRDQESIDGCEIADSCPTRKPLERVHQRIVNLLDDVTMQELSAPTVSAQGF